MLICNGDTAYKCSKMRKITIGKLQDIQFTILESVSHKDVADLFENNTFYFYDDVLQGRFAETNNTELIGLGITYNADSTCDIKIKLRKRSC